MKALRRTLAATLLSLACNAQAQEFDLDIPRQDLSAALLALAEATGVQLLYPSGLLQGLSGPALRGSYTTERALAELLAGHGLSFRQTAPGTISIEKPAVENSTAQMLPAVQVIGQREVGANGSRDVFATENSGSYAAAGSNIGGTAPSLLRDIPRSISVLGQAQIRDTGVSMIAEGLRLLPGVFTADFSQREVLPIVRGHQVTRYQIDGGPPTSNVSDLLRVRGDLTPYDRIELLRGADGLGDSHTEPGGILNYVRKRPLDQARLLVEARAGSWDDYKSMVDVSSPLGFDGRLRGRAVASLREHDYFQDGGDARSQSAYAIIEADVAQATVVSGGLQYFAERATPSFSLSLPVYLNGEQIGLPRSTSYVLPWHYNDNWERHVFFSVESSLPGNWRTRLTVDHDNSDEALLASAITSAADPQAPTVDVANAFLMQSRNTLGADLKLNGGVLLGGYEQQLAFNVNASRKRELTYDTFTIPFTYRFDVFDFDPADYPAPTIPSDPFAGDYTRFYTYNASVAAVLQWWAPLKLTTAWRWHSFGINDERNYEKSSPSYIGASYAIDPRWVALASWSTVYNSNYGQLDTFGQQIRPAVGSNYEAGIRYVSDDSGLTAAAFLYRVRLRDLSRIETDPERPSCCFVTLDTEQVTQGVDLEISGAITPAVQLSASYNYGHNREEGRDSENPGRAFDLRTPRHLFKLWSVWRPMSLPRLRVGGGVRAQSRSNVSRGTDFLPMEEVSQGGYATIDLFADWRWAENWNVEARTGNVLDRSYYANTDPLSSTNIYGMPRNFSLTLRGEWR